MDTLLAFGGLGLQMVIDFAVLVLLVPPLIRNFEPENAWNTGRNAVVSSAIIAVGGRVGAWLAALLFSVIFPPLVLLAAIVPWVIIVVVYKKMYRLSAGLAIGIMVLAGLLVSALGLGTALVAAFLWDIHPLLVGLAILVILGIFALRWAAKRNLQKKLDAVQ